MNETRYEATGQHMSPTNVPVFPSRRLIVLLATLVPLVMLIMIMFFSFASQEVPGPWRSREYFFEPGKDSESSSEGSVTE